MQQNTLDNTHESDLLLLFKYLMPDKIHIIPSLYIEQIQIDRKYTHAPNEAIASKVGRTERGNVRGVLFTKTLNLPQKHI